MKTPGIRVGLVIAFLALSRPAPAAEPAADVTPSPAPAAPPAAPAAAAQEQPIKSYPLGPLTLSLGLVDTKLRLGLKGSYDGEAHLIDIRCDPGMTITKEGLCVSSGVQLAATVDAAWLSGGDAHNYTEFTVHPQFFQTFISRTEEPPADMSRVRQEMCSDPDSRKWLPICFPAWLKDHPIRRPWFGYALYPELEYRSGTISQKGQDYSANQLFYGGGVKLFYPAQIADPLLKDVDARRPGDWLKFFATTPYVAVNYDKVDNYGHSNLPDPTGVRSNYVTAEGQIEVYIPGTRDITRARADWIALAKLSGSHAARGGGGWDVARTFQLIVQVDAALKPVITYKSGADKGFDYDRQVLLGILYSFADPQQPATIPAPVATPATGSR